jgi:transcriptional regulator with XRE-family HTH domain
MVDFRWMAQGRLMRLLPAQCRAARGLLNWRQADLALRAGLSRSTVRDFEGSRHDPHDVSKRQIVAALEAAGVEFLCDGDGRIGVRMLR